MSNTQFAFIKKQSVPMREALQASIDALGFDLKLDPEFTPFEDEGFSPCILNGVSELGFEIFYEPTEDVLGEDEELQALAGDNDYCISMVWRSSLLDLACVLIVSCALAKDFGAIISFEGEAPESVEDMLEQAQTIIADEMR